MYIDDIGLVPTIQDPLVILCDNISNIVIANDAVLQKRTKHIHRRFNYIRDKVERDEINIRKVHFKSKYGKPIHETFSRQAKHDSHVRTIGFRYSREWIV